jgi:replicative DNA helicase
MEEQKSTTYRAMATYELGKNVRTKDDARERGVAEAEVEQAALDATKGERTIVFEMRSGDDPLEVLEYCRLAAGVYGADYIFVDHVQRLAYLGGVDGATSVLTKLASNLAQLAKELNIGIILISHVNEDGHTKYAKSLEEEAIICIRIEREKEATDEDIRNTTKFHIEKNRPFSKLGYAGAVYYDPETTLLKEIEI